MWGSEHQWARYPEVHNRTPTTALPTDPTEAKRVMPKRQDRESAFLLLLNYPIVNVTRVVPQAMIVPRAPRMVAKNFPQPHLHSLVHHSLATTVSPFRRRHRALGHIALKPLFPAPLLLPARKPRALF